jgi:hypothetical protein
MYVYDVDASTQRVREGSGGTKVMEWSEACADLNGHASG